MKLSDSITISLYKYLQGMPDIILPNFYVGIYEMDVMQMKKSGYITEYEIKISRADFMNDFKKGRFGGNKHDFMKCGKGYPNRFVFVVPENMVSIDEVPKHAGLAYYCKNPFFDNYTIRLVKPPPIIHKNKNFDTPAKIMSLVSKISARELMWRNKLNMIKMQMKNKI